VPTHVGIFRWWATSSPPLLNLGEERWALNQGLVTRRLPATSADGGRPQESWLLLHSIRTDDEYADVISRAFVARRPSGIYWWSRRAPPNSEWRQGDLAMKDGSILIAEGSIWLPTAIRGRWRSRGRNGNEVSAWQLVVHAALFCSTSPPRWCKTKIYITYQNYTSSSISTSSVEVLFFYNVMLKLDVTSPSLLWVTC
jgi:hypothetical protein